MSYDSEFGVDYLDWFFLGGVAVYLSMFLVEGFDAFSYGVPPHAGIANGIDRFLAVILNEPSIREVIAFPKTGDNRDLMMDIPSGVSQEQLDELKIKTTKKK